MANVKTETDMAREILKEIEKERGADNKTRTMEADTRKLLEEFFKK